MRRGLLLLVVVGGAVAVGPASPADTTRQVTAYAASLASGGERPSAKGVRAGAGGLFSALVTQSGGKKTIAWRLSFNGLTGGALAAHIHTGKPGQAGPVVLPLCGPCKPGAQGKAALDSKVAAAIESGGAYVNVHTKINPGGEIRGQIGTSHASQPRSTPPPRFRRRRASPRRRRAPSPPS